MREFGEAILENKNKVPPPAVPISRIFLGFRSFNNLIKVYINFQES